MQQISELFITFTAGGWCWTPTPRISSQCTQTGTNSCPL